MGTGSADIRCRKPVLSLRPACQRNMVKPFKLPVCLANCALHPRFVFSRALKRLSFLASFCQNVFLTSDEIITPAAPFACTEKRFLAFAAATLGGHLAQSSAARRIKGSNSKFASRERAPFIAVEGKQLTSLVREDGCELVRLLWLRI